MTKHVDDPSSGPTAVVGIIFALLVAITLLALEAYFSRVRDQEFAAKVEAQPSEKWERVRVEQLETMAGYRWVDRDSGTVAIPIERAMELVTEELAASGGTE